MGSTLSVVRLNTESSLVLMKFSFAVFTLVGIRILLLSVCIFGNVYSLYNTKAEVVFSAEGICFNALCRLCFYLW